MLRLLFSKALSVVAITLTKLEPGIVKGLWFWQKVDCINIGRRAEKEYALRSMVGAGAGIWKI